MLGGFRLARTVVSRLVGAREHEDHGPVRARLPLLLAVVLIPLASASQAAAYQGELDATFGDGGSVSFTVPSGLTATAIQPDGKVVVAGFGPQVDPPDPGDGGPWSDVAIARFNPDGSPDLTFGDEGVASTDFGSRYDRAFDVAIQPDGRILVLADQAEEGFGVARYEPDGDLDLTFDDDGKFVSTFEWLGSSDTRWTSSSLAVESGGGIIVAVTDWARLALVRLTPTGTLDGTFGENGAAIADAGRVMDVLVQPDGRIVAAGFDVDTGDFVASRFTQAGMPDPTFGADGEATIDFAQPAYAEAVALQADGNIVLAGSTEAQDLGRRFALARLTTDGELDATFGHNGKTITRIGSRSDNRYWITDSLALDLAVQGDGRIVAVGESRWDDPGGGSSRPHLTVTRYLPDGRLDTEFHGDGITTDFGQRSGGTAVALQSDGGIVVTGHQFTPVRHVIARYHGTGAPGRQLDVIIDGPGDGMVSGPGIACPGDCTETYESGSPVTLTPEASVGSAFGNWDGGGSLACSWDPECTLTLSANHYVTANFGLLPASPPPIETEITALRVKQRERRVTLRFKASGGEGSVTFECRLRGRTTGFRPCSSPKIWTRLGSGKHVAAVRATDGTGESDPTPARATFRIPRD